MRQLLVVIICAILPGLVYSQCLTDFTKLLPEPSVDYSQDFGRSISMHGDFLAVGAPNNDSLGRITGLVRIYKKVSEEWKLTATVRPSDPKDALQFGVVVKMSQDYLLVGAAGYGGKVYLYKKPPSGWTSQTELTSFTVSNSAMFGAGFNSAIDISDDQNTIAIADQSFTTSLPQNYMGAIFIYHKQPFNEWHGSIAPTLLMALEVDAVDFGRGGVVIDGDRIITSTPYAPTSNGAIYIFRDPSGEFSNPVYEARLTSGSVLESGFLGFKNIVATDEGIFTSASIGMPDNGRQQIIFFEKPLSGNWTDNSRTCSIDPFVNEAKKDGFITLSYDGTDIYASCATSDGKGFLTVLRNPSSWCAATPEVVDSFTPTPSQLTKNYGYVNASSSSGHVTVGFLPHPDNEQAQIALKVFSKQPGNSWTSKLLYPLNKSTAGHYYGNDILGLEDYLFVGAPYDGTVRVNGGAVYTYKKSGATWQKTGKILPIPKTQYDDVFGTALATNGTHLAVGAAGFGEHGRVFVYKKKNSDWTQLEMVQEIELPEDILTIYAYGDNLAMNDEWLLIPYVQNSPARIMLAVYKFNGSAWDYDQVLELGLGSLFAKSTTLAVAIENEIIVAGGSVIELSNTGVWEKKCVLSPSDPEPMQISPDFTHWITNGSSFGHDVAISNNTIFISAPQKDFEGTWDVGAIYVYTRKPGQPWTSRTESTRILPRVKDEGELFGYSMEVLGNTMIAGAPGADFLKTGVPRNKPGRAYVFQSLDYFWEDVIPLIDITGDSFVKDYYGIAVNLDETDFFIGAPVQDIETGKLSGAVYITPTPPIIKLVPPVCSANEVIDLFGYPYGGTWMGPGIIDAAEGTFDPRVAGIGTHEFTYTTVSCAYEGKLRIEVEEPVDALLDVESEILVCESATYLDIALGVHPVPDGTYQWYYRGTDEDTFVPLNELQPTMRASGRGEYFAKITTDACESSSAVVTVRNEQLELFLTPLSRICESSAAGIPLSGLPAGGKWYGPGVTDNKLFPNSLPNSMYTLRYDYTSQLGCNHKNTMLVEIARLQTPSIKRGAGNLCSEGEVTLQLTTTFDDNIQYDWVWKAIEGDIVNPLSVNNSSLTISDRGIYQLTASDGQCTTTSNALKINDSKFEFKMSPDGNELKTCGGNVVELVVTDVPGRSYQWFYSASAEQQPDAIPGEVTNSIQAEKSGYYHVEILSGVCSGESPRKAITISGEDRVYIPNVFTPNGDGYNDVFKIESNQDDIQLFIINRYGQEIFSGDATAEWNGDGAPSGVYFWNVFYDTCTGERIKEKGTVHLVR